MKKQNDQKDKGIFIALVLMPIELLCVAWMWSKHGFAYGLLAASVFTASAFFKFFAKK